MADPKQEVVIDYTNHRGERAHRRVRPRGIVFENNEWHPETQWLLEAVDLDKGAERTFALVNVHEWFTAAELATAERHLRKRVSQSYLQRVMQITYSRADSIVALFRNAGKIIESDDDGSLTFSGGDGE